MSTRKTPVRKTTTAVVGAFDAAFENTREGARSLIDRGRNVVKAVEDAAAEPAKGARQQALTARTEATKAVKQFRTAMKRSVTATEKATLAVRQGASAAVKAVGGRSGSS